MKIFFFDIISIKINLTTSDKLKLHWEKNKKLGEISLTVKFYFPRLKIQKKFLAYFFVLFCERERNLHS